MTDNSIAMFGLIGASIGAIPGILGVLIPWLRNRDDVARASRNLELARKEVEFIGSWLQTMSEVCSESEMASLKLQARQRLDQLLVAGDEASAQLQPPPAAAPAPKRRLGTLSYVYLGFFGFMMFGASIDENDEVSLDYFLNEISGGDGQMALIVFAVPLLFIFYRWWRPKAE